MTYKHMPCVAQIIQMGFRSFCDSVNVLAKGLEMVRLQLSFNVIIKVQKRICLNSLLCCYLLQHHTCVCFITPKIHVYQLLGYLRLIMIIHRLPLIVVSRVTVKLYFVECANSTASAAHPTHFFLQRILVTSWLFHAFLKCST